MAKSFNILREQMSPERRARVAEKTKALIAEYRLQELRQLRNISQEQLAQVLEKTQAGISRTENRNDIYLSTLRRYVEALGGKLELIASFPEGDVKISQIATTAA